MVSLTVQAYADAAGRPVRRLVFAGDTPAAVVELWKLAGSPGLAAAEPTGPHELDFLDVCRTGDATLAESTLPETRRPEKNRV